MEFLTRRETRQRIQRSIDAEDHTLLAAIGLLGQPDEDTLFRFVENRFDFGRFRWMVMNHRDRLLVIDGSAPGTVMINPLLADDPIGAVVQPRELIAGMAISPDDAPREELPWFSRTFVLSLYAFLREDSELFTRSGALRKRTEARLSDRFGMILTGDQGVDRLQTALTALVSLGLLSRESHGQVALRPDSWDELARVPDRWIQALLWAAALNASVEHAFDVAALLLEFIQRVPNDKTFSAVEIHRIIQLMDNGNTLAGTPDGADRLAETGVLLRQGERFAINPAVQALLEDPAPGITIQANMDITVHPETPFRDLLDLARIAHLKRYDIVAVFELTENGFTSARREDRDTAIPTLENLSGGTIPQNVKFLLDRWIAHTRAVRLLHGLVLVVEQDAAEILHETEAFRPYIRERLGPGVFLIDRTHEADLENLLRSLGISSTVQRETTSEVDVDTPEYYRYYLRRQQPLLTANRGGIHLPVESDSSHAAEEPRATATPAEPPEPPEPPELTYTRELADYLETLDLPADVHQELALRIERKLILYPEQIRSDVIPQYGIEARGLDYVGKIRIAEQAIKSRELLEIIMRSAEGAPQRLLVQPREMVQSGDDLMLRAVQLPEQNPVRVRIRRASLVRRLSGTLLRPR